MQLVDLRNEVMAHGFDPTFFGNSRVNQFINDAYYLVCRRVEWYADEATYDFNTVTGQAVYPFPLDFMKGRSVRDTARDGELLAVSLRDIDRSDTTQGAPIFYAIDGPNVHLYPTPDNVYTLEMRYWKLPNLLVNDTDVPIIPDTYQRLLWYWAVKEAYAAEDDGATGQYWEQQFNTVLAEFASDVRFPMTDYPTQVAGMWEQQRSLGQPGWSMWGWTE